MYLKDAAYQNDRVFKWAVAVQEYSEWKTSQGMRNWERISSVGQVILVNVDMFSCNLVISWFNGNLYLVCIIV